MAQNIIKKLKGVVKEAMITVLAMSVDEELCFVDATAYAFVDLRDSKEQDKPL